MELEKAFEKMDGIIEKLESEDITLEESFQVYKEGMDLLKQCNEDIDRVEKQVKILSGEEENE